MPNAYLFGTAVSVDPAKSCCWLGAGRNGQETISSLARDASEHNGANGKDDHNGIEDPTVSLGTKVLFHELSILRPTKLRLELESNPQAKKHRYIFLTLNAEVVLSEKVPIGRAILVCPSSGTSVDKLTWLLPNGVISSFIARTTVFGGFTALKILLPSF